MKAFVLPTIFTAVDRFSSPVAKINKQLKSVSQSAMQVSKTTAIMGAAILAPMALAANEAVKFEDKMADVAKTSGLAGVQLAGLGDDILAMSSGTRTSIDGLQEIAKIGGQMGVQGRGNINAFTDSVNKFNVALGSDFSGGVEEATRAIGGLNVLFKETRQLKIDESITRAGSAMNALSAKGVQVPEMTEFTKRIGALPDAIKPTIQDTVALSAVFNKVGISSEIASRGLSDILMTAAKNKSLPNFAKQMNMSQEAVKNLLNTNPTQFLKVLAKSLKGLDAVKIANVLKGLDIGDIGAIKTIGALSSSVDMLTEFQSISNKEFAKGTSLIAEYNVKNETMAAKIARSKNNFQAMSIIIGTELLPIIGDLVKEVMPVIKQFTNWIKQNKPLVATLLKVAIGIAGLMFVISGLSLVVGIFTKAMILLNIIMSLNPVALITLAIIAMIGVVIAVVKWYDKWGAAATFLLGPIGFLIDLVMSFRRNWDMITKAFKDGGILAGIKAIGATLLDAVLMPLQQIMKIIADMTGADWANNAVKNIEEFRKGLGVEMGAESNTVQPANPQQERQQSMWDQVKTTTNNKLAIDINDPNGRAKVSENSGAIPIMVKSTHNYGR